MNVRLAFPVPKRTPDVIILCPIASCGPVTRYRTCVIYFLLRILALSLPVIVFSNEFITGFDGYISQYI